MIRLQFEMRYSGADQTCPQVGSASVILRPFGPAAMQRIGSDWAIRAAFLVVSVAGALSFHSSVAQGECGDYVLVGGMKGKISELSPPARLLPGQLDPMKHR